MDGLDGTGETIRQVAEANAEAGQQGGVEEARRDVEARAGEEEGTEAESHADAPADSVEAVAASGAEEATSTKLASDLAQLSVNETETEGGGVEGEAAVAPDGSLASDADTLSAATTTTTTAATPAGSATTTGSLSMPALQKKFTSLSVNKQFLEKASPTLAAASVPVISKTSSTQPSGRLVSSSPASRLTSAKLSTTVSKPPSSGWGQIASPGIGSPSADPLPSISSSGVNKAAPSVASPKLVTALTSGSAVRSTSPQKGSPGLRNASLAASGRGVASGPTASSASTSSKVPWATVRAENAKSALSSDFPTAAEAARAKLEAERKEKAAAAEAAARAEQALQHLERFRGTSLGAGNHWDEMDDEDEMDEVVQFGDGTQYKVPVKKEDEPVSKEERFKDVGHDRSLPFSSSTQSGHNAASNTTTATARPTIATRPSANRDSHPSLLSPNAHDIHGGPPKLYNSKTAHKMEIRPGGGISLDTEVDRGYNQRGGSMFRKDREGGGHAPSSSHAAAAASTPPARAWGPLAQRQASLNPDAPKPAAIVSPPVSQKGTSVASPTPAAASAQPLSKTLSQASNEPAAVAATRPNLASQSSNSVSNRSAGGERALPPHLALQAAQSAAPAAMPAKTIPVDDKDRAAPTSTEVQATPYGARFAAGGANARPGAASSVPAPAHKPPALTAEHQKEEMLSAAERARKRRQEEEDKRLAEKERARAKAAAIEEKMRLAKEEEERKKREEEEARQRKREAEAEERRRQEREAAASAKQRLEQQQQQQQQSLQQQRAATERPALEGMQRTGGVAAARPALLSPSDEAVSWRKTGSASLAAPGPGPAMAVASAAASQNSFRDVRPTPVEYAASTVTLLQRPTKGANGDPLALSPTSGKRHVADVSLTRNGNAMLDTKMDAVKIPTGPRAASRPSPMEAGPQAQVKMPGRGPRVEIIAPTDAGAAQHRADELKQREARQTQRSPAKQPVGVLKTSTSPAPDEEEAETRTEVTFEGAPVWNRYRVKVGTAGPAPRLPRRIVEAQSNRIADFQEGKMPKAVDVLSWEPPIPNLSSRTLSRDDLFHPKKFRKGIVIAQVAMPKTMLQRKAGRRGGNYQQSDAIPQPVVKVPSAKGFPQMDASVVPTTPTKMPSASFQKKERGSMADTGNFANETGSFPNASSNTPSPVNFMASSGKRGESQVSLPLSPLPPSASASASSVLPSPSQMASTWGQTPLFNLDRGDSARLTADRDHIREVWAHSTNDGGNMQNSLKGIVDEFPDVAAQYHDVGINTADTHHSAPASRIYSPLVSPHDSKRSEVGRNGFTTSASSPAFAASGRMEGPSLPVENGGVSMATSLEAATSAKDDGGRQAMAHGFQSQQPGQPAHQREDRRSTSNAFSAYAYPSPIQEASSSSANFFNQQRAFGTSHHHPSPHHHQQQQRYAQYENGGGYAAGGGAGVGYGSSYQRGISHPPAISLAGGGGGGSSGMPHQHASGPAGGGPYHSPQGPHRRQNQASPGSMRNPYPPQPHQQQGSGNSTSRGSGGPQATDVATSPTAAASMRAYRSTEPSSTVWESIATRREEEA